MKKKDEMSLEGDKVSGKCYNVFLPTTKQRFSVCISSSVSRYVHDRFLKTEHCRCDGFMECCCHHGSLGVGKGHEDNSNICCCMLLSLIQPVSTFVPTQPITIGSSTFAAAQICFGLVWQPTRQTRSYKERSRKTRLKPEESTLCFSSVLQQ